MYMNEPYSILMQKTTENAPVKDSLAHFGIVCTEFPFKPGGETKDLPNGIGRMKTVKILTYR
jgi:hypothetical protein